MNLENTTVDLKTYIEKVFIQEANNLIASKNYLPAFIFMTQAIEVLGGFYDAKPAKALNQSKLRFSHAINRLMPTAYRVLNNNHYLYEKLRTGLVHSFSSSDYIILSNKENTELIDLHLQKKEDKLILIAEDFHQDFLKACEKFISGIGKGFIHQKKEKAQYKLPLL